MRVRFEIQFTGNVQGVGFRYTAVNVAQSYEVTGWVRNEADRSVRCVAEGEQDEIERFVAAVRQSMQGNIRNIAIARTQATGEFKDFAVRR